MPALSPFTPSKDQKAEIRDSSQRKKDLQKKRLIEKSDEKISGFGKRKRKVPVSLIESDHETDAIEKLRGGKRRKALPLTDERQNKSGTMSLKLLSKLNNLYPDREYEEDQKLDKNKNVIKKNLKESKKDLKVTKWKESFKPRRSIKIKTVESDAASSLPATKGIIAPQLTERELVFPIRKQMGCGARTFATTNRKGKKEDMPGQNNALININADLSVTRSTPRTQMAPRLFMGREIKSVSLVSKMASVEGMSENMVASGCSSQMLDKNKNIDVFGGSNVEASLPDNRALRTDPSCGKESSPAPKTIKLADKYVGIREYSVQDMIKDVLNCSMEETDPESEVYHIFPLKEINLEELLKLPSDSEVLKEKELDAKDLEIEQSRIDHNEEMKAVQKSIEKIKMRQKMRRLRFKENHLRRNLLQAELTKTQILETFNKHYEIIIEIKSGKVQTSRSKAFIKGGDERWGLNLIVYDGCFRDDHVTFILDLIDEKTSLTDVDKMLNSDFNWKVLLPEILIKVRLF